MGETDREKLGLVLMGGAMLSKSLIQFSIDGWSCVPSLLFDLRPNYGGDNEVNGTQQQQTSTDPCLHWRLLDTYRQVWVSLLLGSLLLSPGFWCTQDFVCVLQESVSPVLCKFWWLYGGVNGNLL